ncbi:MAG: hypothetical protein AB7O65_03815 [Candidatus Korobacteraceae bacterium]
MAGSTVTPGIPEITLQEEELVITIRAVAWTVLVIDALLLIFVPNDIQAGWSFWTVWAFAQGFLGLLLFGYASRLERRAIRRIVATPIAPSAAVENAPSPRVDHPRAA